MTMAAAAGTEVNVTALIDGRRIGSFQVRVALLCAATVFFDGFDAQTIGYVAPTISKAWRLTPGALAPVIAWGLIGLAIGALSFSLLADRIGRKPVIIASTFAFGICSLLTASADSPDSLLLWRFLTGLGLGGAMPNPIALTTEYSPQKSRATMVMAMFVGFSLGSAVGGAIAAQIVPIWGWRSVFVLGGIFPIVLAPVLVALLPESIRLLALRGTEGERVAMLLARIDPTWTFAPGTRFVAPEEHPPGFAVLHLFRERRAAGTLLLWIMFFTNLLDLYLLASWLPTVINNAGISVRRAVITTATLQVGGIAGVLTFARLIDRFGFFRILPPAYFAAGLFIAAIGAVGADPDLIMATVIGAGFCVVGAQTSSNALAGSYYPTFIRSTGVGWALGIGRIGSIIGPTLGGIVLAQRWPMPTIFLAGAVPVFIAAAAAFTLGQLQQPAEGVLGMTARKI
jgi:AAHS family 4-hydroxybenzoate transporter-like MFS transporter